MEDYENLDPASIMSLVPVDSIIEVDSYATENLNVGDFVGFVTDFNASNSYKTGVVRILGLHRSSCDWYEGTTLRIDFEVKVQVDGRWTE